MFERFTDRARRVVVLAQEEARLLNHNYIGTEHLLLGLARDGEGVAAEALASAGISLEALRQQVPAITGRGKKPPSGHIPFTARAKNALARSAREADAMGHDLVGSEHILLGLLREGDGVAVQVLVRLEADLNLVRDQARRLVHTPAVSDAAAGGSRPGDEALARVASLQDRLAAVERWVGMRSDLDDLDDQIARVAREKEAAIDQQDLQNAAALRDRERQLIDRRNRSEQEPAGAAADRPSLAREVARLNAELERLQAVLRQHGIEAGGDVV